MTKIKIPANPLPVEAFNMMEELLQKISGFGELQKVQLEKEEQMLLFRFFVKSFSRTSSLTDFLVRWSDSFAILSKKIRDLVKDSNSPADIVHYTSLWFNAFCEIFDEWALVKYGAIVTTYDSEEHKLYLLPRLDKEKFPGQLNFDKFSSCSVWGCRDLLKLIKKVSFELYVQYLIVIGLFRLPNMLVQKLTTFCSSMVKLHLKINCKWLKMC